MSLESRLTALLQVLGADYKALKTQADGLSSKADSWTSQVITSPFFSSSAAIVEPFVGFVALPSTRYAVDICLMVQSGANTTGIQAALAGPTATIPRVTVKIVSAAVGTPDMITHSALNVFQPASAGLNTSNILTIQSIVEKGSQADPTPIRPQIRPEVPETYFIHAGIMRWRKI